MNSESNKNGGSRLRKSDMPPKPKKPKKPRTKEQKLLQVLYIVAVVLAAIVVALFIAYKLLVVKPTVPEQPSRPSLPQTSQVPGATEPPPVTSDRKKDFYTFLVIGKDTGGGGNTDTILLAAYDIPNQKLSVMSIPRDTLVNIPYDIKKINAVYNYGGGGEEGLQYLNDEISQLVGFVPDFQVVVEWEAVGKLVDAIGGVYYDVPRNMDYEDPTQNLKIHVDKGYQLLDGKKAMQVVRFREGANGYANGDLGRIETQQGFLAAVIKQCLQFKNVTKIGELAEIFTTYVDTNLTVNNLAWFAQEAIFGGLDMENVNFVTMPWVSANGVWSRTYNNRPSYVAPDVDALVTVVNENFNPFADELRRGELDIMYVNKDGTLGSTTGVVEDTKYNTWVKGKGSSSSGGGSATPSAKPEPTPSPTPEVSPSPQPGTSAEPGASTQPSQLPAPSPAPGEPTLPEEPAPSATTDPGPALPQETTTPAPTPTPAPNPSQTPATPPPGLVTESAVLPSMPTPAIAG